MKSLFSDWKEVDFFLAWGNLASSREKKTHHQLTYSIRGETNQSLQYVVMAMNVGLFVGLHICIQRLCILQPLKINRLAALHATLICMRVRIWGETLTQKTKQIDVASIIPNLHAGMQQDEDWPPIDRPWQKDRNLWWMSSAAGDTELCEDCFISAQLILWQDRTRVQIEKWMICFLGRIK